MLYPKSFDHTDGPEPWPAHNGQTKPKRKPNSYQYDPESQYDPYEYEQDEYDQHHRQQYANHDQGPKYIITGSSDDGYFKYILILLVGLVFVGGINVWKTTHNGLFTQQAMAISVQSNKEQTAYAQRWNENVVRGQEENSRREVNERAMTAIQFVKTPSGTISYTGGVNSEVIAAAIKLTVSQQEAKDEMERLRLENRANNMQNAQKLTKDAMENMQKSGDAAVRAIKDISSGTSNMASGIVNSVNDMTENVIEANTRFAEKALETTKFQPTSK